MRGFASALVLLDLRLASAGPLPPKRKLQQQEAVKGPGAGPWELAAPETYGMNAEALERAFIELESSTPNRYCSIVAKEGKLVHERYNPDHQRVERNGRGAGIPNTPQTRYEVDSAGKTMQALMMGVGVTKGLYDLDTPLADYGVQPQAAFGPNNMWWPELTLRDVLSQTTGQGYAEPGTAFTYDSDSYIAHGSHLIEAVTGQGSAAWATQNFADPMGMPDLYTLDGEHTDIGGGQMMSCREMAKIGQLLLNRGMWKDADGQPFELISSSYVDQVTTPQHPEFVRNYGLLTWLNNDAGNMAKCCSARWCTHWTGPTDPTGQIPGGTYLPEPMLGANTPNAAIAVGWLGRTMIVIPEQEMVLVTFGSTWGSGPDCDSGSGYSEEFTAGNIWRTLTAALQQQQPASPAPAPSPPPVDMPPCPQTTFPGDAVNPETRTPFTSVGAPAAGACNCWCPPDEGFGQCYPAANAAECAAMVTRPEATQCSAVAVIEGCDGQPDADSQCMPADANVCIENGRVDNDCCAGWGQGSCADGFNFERGDVCYAIGGVPLAFSSCCKPANGNSVASSYDRCAHVKVKNGAAWDQCDEKPCMSCTSVSTCSENPLPWDTSACQCTALSFSTCEWVEGGSCNPDNLYTNPQDCVVLPTVTAGDGHMSHGAPPAPPSGGSGLKGDSNWHATTAACDYDSIANSVLGVAQACGNLKNSIPAACSGQCAPLFTDLWDSCPAFLRGMEPANQPGGMAGFYSKCVAELQH